MLVRYILSSVCLRLSQFSEFSFMQYMGLCVLSLPISLLMIVTVCENILMGYCKTAVTPFVTHWRYSSLALKPSIYLTTVETPYNTNVGVQKIPDRAIWKPVVAKRNNTNPWSCSEPQILVTRDSRRVHMAEQPASAIGLSKFLPSCIHHRLPDNSLISVNL